jgi:dephospho-CoA kinase
MVYRRCIAICGKKRSGKDTVSRYLADTYGYTHAKFSDPLKKVTSILFSIPEHDLENDKKDVIDPRWGVEPRRLLQFLGTEMMQFQLQQIVPHIGRTFWAKNLVQRTSKCTNVVISDLRFVHEVDTLKESFDMVTIVKIVRDYKTTNGPWSIDTHMSETELENIDANYTILNDHDVDTLIQTFASTVQSNL